MSNPNAITAYNVKTKEKNVPMQDAVISKTERGGYIAKGHDGKGNKLTSLLRTQLAVNLLVVNFDQRLFPHNTG